MINIASIEKRSETTYRITVSCGYLPNGKKDRRHKTIKLPDGLTERQKEKEIQKQAVLFEQQVESGTFLDGEKITFGQFAEKWLADYAEKQLAPKTVFEYKNQLYSRIIPALGHVKLCKLQPTHLMQFINNLAETGMRLDTKYVLKPDYVELLSSERKNIKSPCTATLRSILQGNATTREIAERIVAHCNIPLTEMFNPKESTNKLTGNTISHYFRLISTILTTAVQWQIITANPCERVGPPKVEKKEAESYDDDKAAKMFVLLENAPIKYQAAIYVALFGGFRLGEVTGLVWSDINMEQGTIKISKAAQYIPGIGQFEAPPKTEKSRREIVLPALAIDKLRKLEIEQKEQRLKMGELWEHHNKVFTQINGRPMFPDTPSKWFHDWLIANNLQVIKFHGLRHTSASLLIAEGVDIATVSKRLGHSNITTTVGIYTHAIQKKDNEAADKLGALFASTDNQARAGV